MSAWFTSLKIGAKRMAPAPLRRAYRLVRALRSVPTYRYLPPELVDGGRLCASRYWLLDHLPHDAVVAELGTYKGDFARDIMTRAKPRALHLVDLNYGSFDATGLDGPNVVRHTGRTTDVVSRFEDEQFDWIYIDADHRYEAVLADAEISAPKVKPGGYLVFNDFAHIDPNLGRYGVHQGVSEFILKYRWQVAFLALDAAGLYDIAIRKPA